MSEDTKHLVRIEDASEADARVWWTCSCGDSRQTSLSYAGSEAELHLRAVEEGRWQRSD
jgi:hypothetical protein